MLTPPPPFCLWFRTQLPSPPPSPPDAPDPARTSDGLGDGRVWSRRGGVHDVPDAVADDRCLRSWFGRSSKRSSRVRDGLQRAKRPRLGSSGIPLIHVDVLTLSLRSLVLHSHCSLPFLIRYLHRLLTRYLAFLPYPITHSCHRVLARNAENRKDVLIEIASKSDWRAKQKVQRMREAERAQRHPSPAVRKRYVHITIARQGTCEFEVGRG